MIHHGDHGNDLSVYIYSCPLPRCSFPPNIHLSYLLSLHRHFAQSLLDFFAIMYSKSSRLITVALFAAVIISINGTKPASWIGMITAFWGKFEPFSILSSGWKSSVVSIYRNITGVKNMMLPSEGVYLKQELQRGTDSFKTNF